MNFESVSRSTIVFVIMLAMAVSASPVALAQVDGTKATLPGENTNETDVDTDIEVGLATARKPLVAPSPTPYKDPARMVVPSGW